MEGLRVSGVAVVSCLTWTSVLPGISATQNLTTVPPSAYSTTAVHDGPVTFDISNTVPQIVLTMIVVAVALIIGLCIGKLGELCYDRHMANRDDISDISEHTREILKANVARMKRKPGTPDSKDSNDPDDMSPSKKRTLLNVWTTSRRTSAVTPSPRRQKDSDNVDSNGNTDSKEDSKTDNPIIQVISGDEGGTTVEVINEKDNKDDKNDDAKNEVAIVHVKNEEENSPNGVIGTKSPYESGSNIPDTTETKKPNKPEVSDTQNNGDIAKVTNETPSAVTESKDAV